MKADINLWRLTSPNRTQITDRVHGPWTAIETSFGRYVYTVGLLYHTKFDPQSLIGKKGLYKKPPKSKFPYLTLLPSFPCSLLLTALGVLRMLPVLQRLGDAYGL